MAASIPRGCGLILSLLTVLGVPSSVPSINKLWTCYMNSKIKVTTHGRVLGDMLLISIADPAQNLLDIERLVLYPKPCTL